MDRDVAYGEMMAMLRASRERSEAEIGETCAFAERHGLDIGRVAPPPRAARAANPVVGKSRPQMDQWIRRALPDGTLPSPTENLILPEAMVRRALALGHVVGEGHPYRATPGGAAWAAGRSRRR